jgi:prevent-host-death family protein
MQSQCRRGFALGTTTVRELKARLSAYLRQLVAGETVTITRHGKPLGRIVPVDAPLEERLSALELAGLLAWNGGRLPLLAPVAQAQGPTTVAALLVEDREGSCTVSGPSWFGRRPLRLCWRGWTGWPRSWDCAATTLRTWPRR